MKKLPIIVVFALLWSLSFPAGRVVSAAPLKTPGLSYLVNNPQDLIASTCPSPTCTLRAAINAANVDGANSSITFSITGTITLTSRLPEITEAFPLVITGPAGGITIDGNNANYQILSIQSAAALTLQDLTLAHAKSAVNGGAITNTGSLTITHCTFLGNETTSGSGGAVYNASPGIVHVSLSTFESNQAVWFGGAIANVSWVGAGVNTLEISQSVFQGNHADIGGAIYNSGGQFTLLNVNSSLFKDNSGTVDGGAIHQGGGATTVINSTLTGNSAGQGGAFMNGTGSSITLINDTIVNNTAGDPGGWNLQNSSGLTYVRNTIISGDANAARNCASPGSHWNIVNDGNNIEDGTSCGWVTGAAGSKGSLSSTDPVLSALADHGGPTQTLALSGSSPAFGRVRVPAALTGIDCPAADQRGVLRPQGWLCDTGAFELEFTPLYVFLPMLVR